VVFTVDAPASVRDRTRGCIADPRPTPRQLNRNFGQSGVDQKTTNMESV
jgi:hypothetical protein